MKLRLHVRAGLLLLLTVSGLIAQDRGKSDQEINMYLSNLPFPMPAMQVPAIPDTKVSIADFGAVADGRTMNTNAINSAITSCSEKGGGTVVIPPGMWLTGPIEMKSNIELRIETGAMVFFSPRFEDYPIPARGNKVTSPIFGRGLKNIALTGKGVFNGNGHVWRPVKKEKLTERQWRELVASGGVVTSDGKMWWPSKEAMNGEGYLKELRKTKKNPTPEEIAGAREFLRPNMVDLVGCTNVLIDGPTFTNTPGWALHPTDCENLIIRNTTIVNNWWGQNTDGADISACRNVLFYRNTLDGGDDAICMKSSFSSKREFALENVVIADCIVYHGHGGFVIGSNTDGGMRNISVKNCTFIGTDIGLRFKSARDRGGIVENIFIDGIRMKDIATSAILFDMFYEGNADTDPSKERIPRFRKFDIRNITCGGARDALFVRGLVDAPIQDITLANVSVKARESLKMENAEAFTLRDLWLDVARGPVLDAKNVKNITINQIATAAIADVLVRARGSETANIRISNSAVEAKKTIELAPEVKPGTVVIE